MLQQDVVGITLLLCSDRCEFHEEDKKTECKYSCITVEGWSKKIPKHDFGHFWSSK